MNFIVLSNTWTKFRHLGQKVPLGRCTLPLCLMFGTLLLFSEAYAQTGKYQRAKQPLQAQTKGETVLRQAPSTKSRILMSLPANLRVLVRGRQGNWLHSEVLSQGESTRGWIYRSRLDITGVAKQLPPPSKPPAEVSPPTSSSAAKSSKTTSSSISRPFRLGVWGGLSRDIRLIDPHFRAGVDFDWGFGPNASLGFSLEAGFQNLFAGVWTPTAKTRLSWPVLGPIRVSAFGGVPIYYLSDAGEKDLLLGIRAGLELDYSLGAVLSRNTRLFTRFWTDALLFGKERITIPFAAVLGLSFRF